MKAKELLEFIRLKRKLGSRMVEITETMDLQQASETYAKYVCKMHGWGIKWFGEFTDHFSAIELSFMDGYIKAMRDNGYQFKNGLVKKRDIMEEDLPQGVNPKWKDEEPIKVNINITKASDDVVTISKDRYEQLLQYEQEYISRQSIINSFIQNK